MQYSFSRKLKSEWELGEGLQVPAPLCFGKDTEKTRTTCLCWYVAFCDPVLHERKDWAGGGEDGNWERTTLFTKEVLELERMSLLKRCVSEVRPHFTSLIHAGGAVKTPILWCR
jgi:hypothetical protein